MNRGQRSFAPSQIRLLIANPSRERCRARGLEVGLRIDRRYRPRHVETGGAQRLNFSAISPMCRFGREAAAADVKCSDERALAPDGADHLGSLLLSLLHGLIVSARSLMLTT